MQRTLIKASIDHIGESITIKGWVNSVRSYGKLIFADIRDRSGIVQIVGGKELSQLKEEFVVEIVGIIRSRDEKYFNDKIITGKVELEVTELKVLAESKDLPFDIHPQDFNVSLPLVLDYRAASLRNQKVQDVFKVQATIVEAFRQFLMQNEFTEIFVPTIVAGSTEGGSEVFPVEYFGYQAYLAQSPQLYKQVLTSIFERVFTVAHAYRAEPSVTTRHLTEYVGLDAEMGFIEDWTEVLRMADGSVKAIFKAISDKHQNILDEYGVTIPKTIDITPTIKLKDALELIYKRTGRDVRNELDMDPEGEREICRWSLEEFGSELVFITHFYTKKRAWYSHIDPTSPTETLTFDLIGRGVEWISGGQRIHLYEEFKNKLISIGQKPEDFEAPYGQTFKYGMPPEGGYCIGLERITQNILGLANVRQASLFPRDMERVDNRLSASGKKLGKQQTNLHDKLISYLKEKTVDFKQIDHEETKTSEDSARVRGTDINQGAKALVMFADNKPVLVVMSAAMKLSNSLFKKAYEIKDLRMATPEEVEKVSSVIIGAVPPFGNLFNTTTYVDNTLLKQAEIAFNAGSRISSVIMKSADFVKLVNPLVGDFAEISAQ